MQHRREIDGLRALAVLPVIFFHAGFSAISGGFLGVDVFFVISGYLITTIILQEMERGEFSLKRFYARRARRILPALFLVVFVATPFAFAWMLPSQYEDYSRSMVAVVAFVSNIYFWRESGYFAAESAEKPLLHTWSLGVEEQFYILFPLMLMLFWHMGRRALGWLLVLALCASLGLSEYASRYYVGVNFFLLPTRAWELLVGALCAFAAMKNAASRHHGLSLLGLLLILVPMFTYTDAMRLPSAYSLAPVLGTALVLRYGVAGSGAARILSWRPFVLIGLISYSAYLWHHALFALARIRLPYAPDMSLMFALAVAALLLGALSWHFVEKPFRFKQHRSYVPNRLALPLAIGSVALLLVIGAYGHFTQGAFALWQQQHSAAQVRAFALIEDAKEKHFSRTYDNGDCVFHTETLTPALETRLVNCQKKYGSGIALIGDSHGINLFFVAKHQAPRAPFLIGMSQAACRPHTPKPTCYYDGLLALLSQKPKLFSTIIYEQAGWHLFTDAHGREFADNTFFKDRPLDGPVPEYALNTPFIEVVVAYLAQLSAYSDVVWFGPRIEPHIHEKVRITLGCEHRYALRPNQAKRFMHLDETIRSYVEKSPVRYRSQIELAQFDMARDFANCEKNYFLDGNHYSVDGEAYFGTRITLQKLLKR